MSDIKAFVKSKNTITVQLMKSFYGGKSEFFRLRDDYGLSVILPILEEREEEEYVEYDLQNEYFEVGHNFIISDAHNMSCPLEVGFYVRSKEFNDDFYYDGDDLGSIYTKEYTDFKVWSPIACEAFLKMDQIYPMKKLNKGVWHVRIPGDLDGKEYTYLVNINGSFREAVDPYAYSSTPNGKKSVVINLEKCFIDLKKENLAPLKHNVDAVIYELHVRDFSTCDDSGIQNKGKFLGFTEKGTKTKNGTPTGLDYIKGLGITHLQLLPIYDFGSVDEYNQFDYYNWGYDPVQYSIPEGSYASNVIDPYSRIIDCKKMIAAIHEAGMRVVMDVVYNHMFGIEITSFHQLMPNYYFRYGKNGEISNGSFCGNDFDSLMPMAHKYIVDSIKRWTSFYGVDGFRFDLMGIIDVDTMNEAFAEAQKIEPSMIIYGEGWNMPSLIDDELKAAQFNNKKMPNIGYFNDRFRDNIKGSTQDVEEKGFATGSFLDIKVTMDVIAGTSLPVSYGYCYLNPNQVVNYVECHDNHTVWDKMLKSNEDESELVRKERQKLMIAMILLSQGIPFLHAGLEFLRTKNGDHNSYISSDEVNKLDYDLMEKNIDVVNYTKALIEFRKNHSIFRLNTKEEIISNVSVSNPVAGVIQYNVGNYVVFFNGNNSNIELKLDSDLYLVDIMTNEAKKNEGMAVLNPISTTIFKN